MSVSKQGASRQRNNQWNTPSRISSVRRATWCGRFMPSTSTVALPTGVLPIKDGSVPSEMALPFLASGIKKPRSSARLPVNAGKVADAATIAGEAGPCEIAEHRLARRAARE
jgi:hypothetical protein